MITPFRRDVMERVGAITTYFLADRFLTGALISTGRGLTTFFAIHGEKKCDS